MTKPNEYTAYFTLVGEFNPSEISTQLGLEPTRTWEKGDLNPITKVVRKFSRWSLYSRLEKSAGLEKQVADVLEQLRPCTMVVRDIRETIDGGMQLVGYFHADYPGFGLDDRTLAELGSLRLGIDCDFYYLYFDKREDS